MKSVCRLCCFSVYSNKLIFVLKLHHMGGRTLLLNVFIYSSTCSCTRSFSFSPTDMAPSRRQGAGPHTGQSMVAASCRPLAPLKLPFKGGRQMKGQEAHGPIQTPQIWKMFQGKRGRRCEEGESQSLGSSLDRTAREGRSDS